MPNDLAVDHCPISPVIDLVFNRWTTPILWALQENGRMRFGDIRRQLVGVTPKVLTQRLRQMERDGLVTRTYYSEMPPRVEYEATALGYSLQPVFETLLHWSQTHSAEVGQARSAFANSRGEKLADDRAMSDR